VAGRGARGAQRNLASSQHFLRTDALASELVRDACVGPGDLVLDLGAGSGRLTAALARRAGRVVAVELDPQWAAQLRGRWPNVAVIEGDAAAIALPAEPFRVVANLPFDSATQILRRLLDDPGTPLVRADVVVEWGAALKRALPCPSTVNDVLWGAYYRFTLMRRLAPFAFDPSPRVHAGVLAIERRSVSLVAEASWHAYRAFVASGFRRGIRGVAPARVIKRLGIGGAAPRDLDAYQWAELFREQSS
jgi:16S rRNA A1518/A1519 N6-dimethyltransferase RsmA/KsgA/DIM1 with predicted DNA glycosylase/AP lyase activity